MTQYINSYLVWNAIGRRASKGAGSLQWWDLRGTSCKAELKVLLLRQHPVGWADVHKGALKASKPAIGAGSSRTTRDSQRYHMECAWKSSRGKGEGREGTKPQVTGPWSGPKPGCPGGGWEKQMWKGLSARAALRNWSFRGKSTWARTVTFKREDTVCPGEREVWDAWQGTSQAHVFCVNICALPQWKLKYGVKEGESKA